MLDSLVRVSRRVDWAHFVNILGYAGGCTDPGSPPGCRALLCSSPTDLAARGTAASLGASRVGWSAFLGPGPRIHGAAITGSPTRGWAALPAHAALSASPEPMLTAARKNARPTRSHARRRTLGTRRPLAVRTAGRSRGSLAAENAGLASLSPSASLSTISSTSLTLFSKFFSSFPHGTCSLSVSRQYLALDEAYHPFSAAFPNNTTRRRRNVQAPSASQAAYGVLTLYDAPFQVTYAWAGPNARL